MLKSIVFTAHPRFRSGFDARQLHQKGRRDAALSAVLARAITLAQFPFESTLHQLCTRKDGTVYVQMLAWLGGASQFVASRDALRPISVGGAES